MMAKLQRLQHRFVKMHGKLVPAVHFIVVILMVVLVEHQCSRTQSCHIEAAVAWTPDWGRSRRPRHQGGVALCEVKPRASFRDEIDLLFL
jgi:hypothetical protein